MLMQIGNENFHTANNGEPARLPVVEEPEVVGGVDYASWLSDDILLIVGWFHAEDKDPLEASLVLGDRSVPLEVQCISYPKPDVLNTGPRAGKVITARLPSVGKASEPLGTLVIRTGATTLELGSPDLLQYLTDLRTLMRGGLSGLEPEPRAEVMEFLASTPIWHHGTTDNFRLSKNLFFIREALRERLPYCVVVQDQPQGLQVDSVMALDANAFYIKGWMRDEEAKITHLTAVSPEGSRVELSKRIFRYRRPEVDQIYNATSNNRSTSNAGFISLFELRAPSYLRTGWTVEMRNAQGVATEVTAPRLIQDTITVRDTILEDLINTRLPSEDLMLNHVFPAVDRLQQRLQETVEVESVDQYGMLNESPGVSIIIPIYRRIDSLEQQLAQFAGDSEILQAELIYVLDSPELADSFREVAAQLFPLYQVPFRVATLRRNVGFYAASNVGACLARGRLLLLLNSEILPNRPGWLGKMRVFYDSKPGIGALGPKLLYEDDGLQHAGMYFSRPVGSSLWKTRHYFKGLHRDLPAANVPRPVPVVNGACLMIDSGLYKEHQGFQGRYVEGDYEDADLCLRLIEAGYENWYLPDAELYQLEEQSRPEALRQGAAEYNAWLQTRVWNDHIEAVMARYAFPLVDRDVGPDWLDQRKLLGGDGAGLNLPPSLDRKDH